MDESGNKNTIQSINQSIINQSINSGPLGTMVMPPGFEMERISVTGSEYNGYAFWQNGYAAGFLM